MASETTIGPEEGGYEPPRGSGPELVGDVIGPYRLKWMIGEGGLGVVWLAERIEDYRQLVAVKFIRGLRESRIVLTRFRREQQALGLMEHDGIAKVHDAGISVRGRPYIVMEYVRGEPITAYCDRKELSIKSRLRLFIKACEAVQHAHLKGIIHRDLTPRNILAFDGENGEPSLKVIDFGLAKSLADEMGPETDRTDPGEMVGTIDYMSPEQASELFARVDTRTDIYALGVILYELVAGTLPFDLRKRAKFEICRIKREEVPPAPSIRLSQVSSRDAKHRSRIERARKSAVGILVRQLRQELDWIPLKAISIEPERRYQTVLSLASDLRNYLNDRPLEAGPPSWTYRFSKFARRNRGVIAASAGFAALFTVGLVLVLHQWRDAVMARAEAEDVTAFLTEDLFGFGDVDRFDHSTPLSRIIGEAEPGVEARFPDEPRRASRILRAMGRAYLGIGEAESARRLFERADVLGDGVLSVAERIALRLDLVESLYRLQDAAATERAAILAREAVHTIKADLSADSLLLATALNQLGGALKHRGDLEGARLAYREAAEIRDRSLPVEHLDRLTTRYNLLLLEAILLRSEDSGFSTIDRARRGATVAEQLDALGREIAATHGARQQQRIMCHREAASEWIRAARLIPDDSSGRLAHQRAVWIQRAKQRLEELEPVAREALGTGHVRYRWIRGDQASAAELDSDREEAIRILESMFEDAASRPRVEHLDLIFYAIRLAGLYTASEQSDRAIALFESQMSASSERFIPAWCSAVSELARKASEGDRIKDAPRWNRLHSDFCKAITP
jgi:serine/threonine protein kinase